jgi:Tfp pilus assembly protein PilO
MKIAVAGLIIVLMAVGFYVVSWSDKYKEIESLKAQKDERIAQKERLEADVATLPKFREEAAALEKELLSLVQSKFTKEEPELFVANYIAEIERLVADQQEVTGDESFTIRSITPRGEQMAENPAGAEEPEEAPADAKGGDNKDAKKKPAPAPAETESETLQGFPTRVFAMDMTGRYSTLVEFLYQLGALELDRLVTINEISLKPEKAEDGVSPVLSITIPITAYLRQGSN